MRISYLFPIRRDAVWEAKSPPASGGAPCLVLRAHHPVQQLRQLAALLPFGVDRSADVRLTFLKGGYLCRAIMFWSLPVLSGAFRTLTLIGYSTGCLRFGPS